MPDRQWQAAVISDFILAADAVEAAKMSPFNSGTSPFDAAQQTKVRDLEKVAAQKQVLVEAALDQVVSDWRAQRKTGWMTTELKETRVVAERALAMIENADELALHASPAEAPRVDPAELHPWVWAGARRQWEHGEYETAVRYALDEILREIQSKTGYTDSGENLFNKAFAFKEPARPGNPRLCILSGAHAANSENRQEGAQL